MLRGQAGGDAGVPQQIQRCASLFLSARCLALPGGSVYLAAVPSRGDCLGGGGRRAPAIARGGSWRRAGGAPSAAPRARSPPSGPGSAAGVTALGSRPRPRSPRVRFRFTTKSPGHRNPTRGQTRPGGPGRGGSAAAGGEVGRERARGGWSATRARRLDLLGSQLRRRGAEEPVLPKPNRKWVTARPGQRSEGFSAGVWGQKCSSFQKFEPVETFFFLSSETCLCFGVEGRPWRGSECAAIRGGGWGLPLARGALFPAPLFLIPPSLPFPTPFPGPTPLGAWAWCPRREGCLRCLGPCSVSAEAEGGGVCSLDMGGS